MSFEPRRYWASIVEYVVGSPAPASNPLEKIILTTARMIKFANGELQSVPLRIRVDLNPDDAAAIWRVDHVDQSTMTEVVRQGVQRVREKNRLPAVELPREFAVLCWEDDSAPRGRPRIHEPDRAQPRLAPFLGRDPGDSYPRRRLENGMVITRAFLAGIASHDPAISDRGHARVLVDREATVTIIPCGNHAVRIGDDRRETRIRGSLPLPPPKRRWLEFGDTRVILFWDRVWVEITAI